MKIKLLIIFFFIGLSIINAQNGLHFDGTNDFIQTNITPVSGSGARTVEAWIKTTALCDPNNSGSQRVIVDWGSTANGSRFTVNLLWSNSIRLEVAGNGISGTIPVNDGNWHHVAAVYDPTATNKVSLYIDGVLNVSGNLTVAVNTSTSVKMRIGQRVDGINHFNGSIDEVRVWNIARTAAQIQADMNTEYCATQTGLVAYYQLNNGTAGGSNSGLTTATDSSGNNYSGTLNNFALTGATSNYVTGATLTQSLNNMVSLAGNTLTSNQPGASYQWIDCDAGNIPVSGANSQSFSPTVAGNYAVQVNANGCTTTSVCTQVTLSNKDFDFEKNIVVYPNPMESYTNINFNDFFEAIQVKVLNQLGQTISISNYTNSDEIELQIEASKGIYFLEINTNSGQKAMMKILKL